MIVRISIILSIIILSLAVLSAQQTNSETIVHDDLLREYIVYVPAVYDESIPTPLLFNFHGYRGQANIHMNSTGMRSVADTAGFILVYPQGSQYFGSTHWNVGAWTIGTTADDIGFTSAMIDTLSSSYNINLERVYSCGYSNGGYFSFELACQLSDRIAAIGSVGGKMSSETYNSCNPSHPTPVVTIHGTADNVVVYSGSQPANSKSIPETNEYWVNHNNADPDAVVENIPNTNTSDGSTVEYSSYLNGENCTSVDHYKVIGGGHDWPGDWGNKDINSNSVIWNFVSKYDINGLINCTTTSIDEINFDSSKVLIYPNPSNEFITIDIDLTKEIECHIYSMNGQRVLSQYLGPANRKINVHNLPPSIYILKVGDRTLKVFVSE